MVGYILSFAFILLRIIVLHMSESEDISRWRFFKLMEEWESVAISILATPEGRSAGTLETLLKFLYLLESVDFEWQAQPWLARNKLDRLEKWLERPTSRIPAWRMVALVGALLAPAPTLQTVNQPSPAATTGGSSAPAPILQTANQPSLAAAIGGSSEPAPILQTAHQPWPAAVA